MERLQSKWYGNVKDIYNQFADVEQFKKIPQIFTQSKTLKEIQSVVYTNTISKKFLEGDIKFTSENFQKLHFLMELTSKENNVVIIDLAIGLEKEFVIIKKRIQQTNANLLKIGTVAVIALIAILIPTGMMPLFSDSVTKESGNLPILLSDTEQQLATAELYLSLSEPETALRIYEKVRQENSNNAESILGSRISISEIQNYDQLLRDSDSWIIIDPNYVSDPKNPDNTILQASFYPEGPEESGILIPRTNTGKITLDISLDTITENILPAIVYPVDSHYPAVIFSKTLDKLPSIATAKSVNSNDLKDNIVVIPGKLTNPDAIFIPSDHKPSLEYHNGKDGQLVVYPYGVSNTKDLPALVFPERSFYPRIITMAPLSSGYMSLPTDYNFDQLAKTVSNPLPSSNESRHYIDLIFENGIKDTSIFSQINPNIPVRIFPNGPTSIPIEYPAG